ncbi:hypothetical protein [Pantoea cypripedii]|uniref:Uncharacterized protein n=1 Tax=Pantoea cypripedii TaxID=55209 RepID=A0A6B9FZG8_PANCY|nr:hypothetical protein [Pantoea cypripedii]QGY29692.1 hypothetical protein CUN67_12430 [Pantoea cypripedii]
MKHSNDISLLKKFTPNEIKSEVFSSEITFFKYYQRNKSEELRELIIHIDNANYSGLFINGGDSSVRILTEFTGETIGILAGRNSVYFFKLYINENVGELISFILIKRKKRTEEELQLMAKKLGVKEIPH